MFNLTLKNSVSLSLKLLPDFSTFLLRIVIMLNKMLKCRLGNDVGVSNGIHVLRYLRNVIMGIYFAALFHLVKYPLAKFFIMSDAELVEKGVMQ